MGFLSPFCLLHLTTKNWPLQTDNSLSIKQSRLNLTLTLSSNFIARIYCDKRDALNPGKGSDWREIFKRKLIKVIYLLVYPIFRKFSSVL